MNAAPRLKRIDVRPNGLVSRTKLKEALILIAVLWMAIFAPGARAQSGAGSIQGTVSDPTGGIIPEASIHVVNQATGVAADTKSNGVGFYLVPDLFTGTYTVTVKAAGMRTYVRTLQLLVDQHAVVDTVLSVGAATAQITVVADPVQLTTTDSGTVSSTLDNDRINQLPMNTRELLSLASQSTPGFDAAPDPNHGQFGQRANGLMGEALEYVADGAPMTNRGFGGEVNSPQSTLPDPDSIQEVTFELTTTPAQYATPGTAVITTKSGSNALHGSLFETAINSYWGVAKTRTNLSNYSVPPYVRNEFGASAGGPLIIPGLYHGKNKTFWFFAYERYSLAATSVEQVSVPTVAMRNGDFSGLSNGQVQVLYDPSTTKANATCPKPTGGTENNPYCRTQFAYNGVPNTINPSLESPATKLLNAITPLPTNDQNPITGHNFLAPNVQYVTIPTITWRIDHNFNEDNKGYLRYTQNNQYNRALRNYPSNQAATIASSAAPNIPAGASGYQVIPVSNFAGALGYTHIFSPSFFAETVLSQQWFMQYVGGGGNPSLNYEKMLGLPNNFGESGFPYISGLIVPFGGTMYNYQSNQILSQIDENLTKTVGRHQMQFGGRYHHERLYYLNDRSADQVAFGSNTTGLANNGGGSGIPPYTNTGNANGDFFLGSAQSYKVNLQPPPSWFRDQEIDGYFQDNYHMSRTLTWNLGVRYEAHPARQTKDGVADTFDPVNHAIVLGAPISDLINKGWTTQGIINNMQNIGVNFETPAQAGFPNALYANANLMVSPRVGVAWQIFGSGHGTVLRGAYGRYIYPVPTRNANPGPKSAPFQYGFTQDYTNAAQAPDGKANYLIRNPQLIQMGANSQSVINTSVSSIVPAITGTFYAADFKPDVVTEVNATVEQSLKGNSAVRLSWVWTHGSYLDHSYYLNNHPSTFVWESQTGTDVPQGTTIGSNQYGATATGPYDQTVYGQLDYREKTGWSNDNELQANYERKFHHGSSFQIYYVWSKAFRLGGNSTRDGITYPYQNYLGVAANPNVTITSPHPITAPALPPSSPAGVVPWADWHGLMAWERYQLDSGVPTHHIQFNYIVDLPVGRGKKLFGNANRFVNELIGGYQIAGTGYMLSQMFQPAASNGTTANTHWGPIAPIHVYKHGIKVKDCLSGSCFNEYLWYNGYIAPTQNANSGYCNATYGVKNTSDGTPMCVYGLPSDYVPYEQPINTVPTPVGGTGGDGTNYNTNNVSVLLPGKTVAETQAYGAGTATVGVANGHPYSKTFIVGPNNWNADASLFKVFPITERVNMRFNMDVFNFLNHQGFNNPVAATGLQYYVPGGASGATSYNPPRQVQFTLRLSF